MTWRILKNMLETSFQCIGMDKRLLEFLRDTLRPDQSELLEVASAFAEYCDDNPSIPSNAIEFLNKLCHHFPFLIKRPNFSSNPDQPTDPPDSPDPPTPVTQEQLQSVLSECYESEQDAGQEQERLSRLNKRKSSVQHVHKSLEKYILELRVKEARLSARTEQAADRTKKAMAVLSVENERFNELVATLAKQIERLKYYLDRNGADPPVLLSHLPMDEFFEAQQKYTNELTRFSKAAFSKDLSEFSSKHKTAGSAADIFTGGDKDSFEKIKSDILQVQSMKSLGLMKKIRLELKLAEVKAKNKCMEEWKEKVETAKQENDMATIFRITRKTEEEVRKNEEKFREECKKVPEMVEKIAMGEISELFDNELKRKITMQEQLLERQEQLIHFLKHQYTTFNLLSHLYQAEMEKVKELSEATQSIKSMLEEVSETSKRLDEHCKEMDDEVKKFSANTPRLIIPSSDKAMHSLYKILRLENKSRFPTYQVLTEAITSLQVKLCVSERRNELVQEANLTVALLAEQKLKKAGDQLSEFEHKTKELVDGPEGRRHLEELLHEFENKVKGVLHTVSSKKHEMLQHPTHALERKMAPAYYTDKQLYAQLKHRVDSIKQSQ